ncbi:flagellar filament capping protein FliD [Burkholderia cenocepacia]|uniref:flagellar filament capping protein FliD n=1 Tax=Burkholderia cenocepacia TaxID=95486 RepID=UPI00073ABFB8|nr:flagellar filament capping protein FliD [Burkholderia cenocepacia]ALV57131.1 flagellar hook protein FliD [Burkholderia cenocepacia]AQQ48267.1 flagellar hook protein FliD [Burkholderia cenocepacia]MBR8259866.1 flagellar filament capping protein FliD [Burkholderia cenocepacia]ONJ05364.1 flagellar hook protein FliD [Burkholderia cenocepacia]ONJ08963.1 flagellar hook protein FliD [Burkholderia cenocepacia]
MSTINPAVTAANNSANSALQQAAQSIISGSTGNSSMDVNSLVTALVNAKTAGQAAALNAQQSSDNTQISAYGALSAALSALQASLTTLSNGSLQNTFTATASGTGLTAIAGAGAVAGSYSVGVTQIATSQSLSSAAFGASTALGTGTMTLSLGSQSFTVDVNGTNNTLSGIAAAINTATGNPGIVASVVNGSDGAHLVLSSTPTGAANTIGVALSNVAGDNGLSSLGVTSTPSTTGGQSTITSANGSAAWKQSTAAQDAAFTINGIAGTSASNTVTSAITGVTLNLTSAAVGATQPQTLTVATDTKSQAAAINNFATLYNTLVTTMGSLSSFTSGASSQGPLLGDSTLNTIKNALASIVASGVNSNGSTVNLASIGVTLQADGTLKVDSTALNGALQNNPTGVASLFNSKNGIGEQLTTNITNYTKTNGLIAARTTALSNDLKNVAQQQTTLSNYAAQLTSQYQAQFTALNTLMATMNSNSQYLTQLFGGANSAGAMSNNKG